MLPPLDTPIAHDGSPECPIHSETKVKVQYEHASDDVDFAGEIFWEYVTTYTIIAPAPADRIAELEAENAALRGNAHLFGGLLLTLVQMLDDLVVESGRGIEYGEEDPFRMGEWFEADDMEVIELARATLKGKTDV